MDGLINQAKNQLSKICHGKRDKNGEDPSKISPLSIWQ